MRTVKLVILALIAIALIVLGAANMAPVDLRLLPAAAGIAAPTLSQVPLALVILGAVLVGIIVGLLVEYMRERKYRAQNNEKRREIQRLRDEVSRLSRKVSGSDDDIEPIIAQN